MDHVAIFAKKRRLLPRILTGEKTVESRWYKHPKTPYRNISKGDTIYLKDSGDPITAKAKVSKVIFHDNLTRQLFDNIIAEYGKHICINESYWTHVKDKRLVTLIFLKDIQQVPPFHIDKTGFGMMAAWLTVDSISRIRRDL
jgi:hypothetical protein